MGRRPLTRSALIRVVAAALLGAGVVLGLRLWVVEPVTVVSDSMAPTVLPGSTLLVSRLEVPASPADVGRLVVFRSPDDGQSTLKRVIAVAGQTLAVRDGVLYVDEVVVPEPHVDFRQVDATFFGLTLIPAGHVFVMGDNREASIDSRDYGPVPVDDVVGMVLWH
ncbi:signal peptidase I [Agrococcus beijingensis]|uniref:signal peptidase I n=1 Tax=Agrococcus beijingensis TaxID=3068634 RepID=UPI002740F255|nr:signal peptidase I [Agrococcus sp. REN33]